MNRLRLRLSLWCEDNGPLLRMLAAYSAAISLAAWLYAR